MVEDRDSPPPYQGESRSRPSNQTSDSHHTPQAAQSVVDSPDKWHNAGLEPGQIRCSAMVISRCYLSNADR